MNIRKATTDDIRQILQIYAYARTQMKRSGNPGQWKDSYPALEIIEQDIQNGTSYVIEDTAQAEAEPEIAAVFVLIHGDDPTYRRIENGSWLNHEPYAAVHRIASSGKILCSTCWKAAGIVNAGGSTSLTAARGLPTRRKRMYRFTNPLPAEITKLPPRHLPDCAQSNPHA